MQILLGGVVSGKVIARYYSILRVCFIAESLCGINGHRKRQTGAQACCQAGKHDV